YVLVLMIIQLLFFFFFFFSSRRRHTRSYGDWSSDVCSSDLFESYPQVRTDRSLCRCSPRLHTLWSSTKRGSLEPGRMALKCGLRSEERRVGKECRARWWA